MFEAGLKFNRRGPIQDCLRVWVVEVERAGHAYEHAKALAEEISRQADVTLIFLKSPVSLAELTRRAAINHVDIVVMATLDTYFLKGLFSGPRSTTSPRLVGVLHDTRKLNKWVRRFVWKSLELLGQIDRVLIYSSMSYGDVLSHGLIRSVRHPVGEITPVNYDNNRREILFFGILSEEKGAGRLQAIAENLPEGYVLRVVGACPDKKLKTRLSAAWQSLIARGKIIWDNGAVDETGKIKYFRSSLCLIAPYQVAHGRASGIAIDAIRYHMPILYSVDHQWMHDLFSSSPWAGAFAMRFDADEDTYADLDEILKNTLNFRSQANSGCGTVAFNYIDSII